VEAIKPALTGLNRNREEAKIDIPNEGSRRVFWGKGLEDCQLAISQVKK
jgi:hypothetical protein